MSELIVPPLTLLSLSFALALIFTVLVRTYLQKGKLLDHPNERSSHKIPVPRGGGLALLAFLLPAMIVLAVREGSGIHYGLIAGTFLLGLISWCDDRKGVGAIKRLSLHIVAACLGSFAFPSDAMILGGALPFWADRTVMIIGWAWFMNLYNFMDGIDGITGAETIALATGTCIVMSAAGIDDPFADNLSLCLTGAALGFLALNWYPAKIFLGDVGSVPLGYLTGFLLLTLAVKGLLAAALILPLYYLADSGLTLIKRALKREKIWQAHREHFYQRTTQALGRHDVVVLWIAVINMGLISAAVTALTYPLLGLTLALGAVAILLWKMHKTAL